MLRLCLAAALLGFSTADLANSSQTPAFSQELIASAGALFLLAGLWTPVVGAVVALNEVGIAFSIQSPLRQDAWIHGFLAILAVSMAMLGPGAWSVDARLFGRKRFDIDRTRVKKRSL